MMSDTSLPERTQEAGLSRVFPIFGIVFGVTYFFVWGYNVAPFSYYPMLNEWVWGAAKPSPETGPPMLYWGWMVYGLGAGATAAVAGLLVPKDLFFRIGRYTSWLAWAVPLAMCYEILYWS